MGAPVNSNYYCFILKKGEYKRKIEREREGGLDSVQDVDEELGDSGW